MRFDDLLDRLAGPEDVVRDLRDALADRGLLAEPGAPRDDSGDASFDNQWLADPLFADEVSILRTVLEHSPLEVFVKDRESRFIYWSELSRRGQRGMSSEELLGKTDFDILADEALARRHYEEEQEILATGRGFVNREYHVAEGTDGEVCFLSTKVPIRDGDGRIVGLLGINNYVTELRQKDAALRAAEREKAAMLDGITDHVVYMDTQRRIIWANRAYATHMGASLDEISGRACPHRHADMCPECPFDEAVATGSLVSREVYPADGTVWTMNAHPVKDEDGRVVGVVEISRDVTAHHQALAEREQLQAAMQRSQRMESIGVLAGGIAHDLNDIMAPILGYAELMLIDEFGERERRRRLEEIVASARRARELINQVLAFAGREDGRAGHTTAQSVIREAMRLLRTSLPSMIEIREDVDQRCGAVEIGAAEVHQILVGLCAKAAHAMRHGGGVLTVSLSQTTIDETLAEQLGARGPGQYVRLSVTDMGEGSDGPVEAADLGEPLGSLAEDGLSTVRRIAAAHGGGVNAYSHRSEGTIVHVYLPLAPTHDSSAPPTPHEAAPGNERIMVVDDEPAVTLMASEMLSALGYSVAAYNDSREALRVFRRDPESIDLLVTDQAMPHLTGRELVASVHALRHDLPVVVSSGFAFELSEDAEEAGIVSLLPKPYSMAELARVIRASLDGPVAHGSGGGEGWS
ncbi:MAG: PAS domain-containing protein [Armatimonadia bacterium]|nr:PAS domain-containing protein [Armatimonadia bacterium]